MKPEQITPKQIYEIIAVEENINLKICVSSQTRSFSELLHDGIQKSELLTIIANYIYLFFSTYFNVSQNITPIQSIMVASEIIKRLDFKIEDVICFLKSIKENQGNEYEKSYNRIDPSIIMQWFNIYLNNRINTLETIKIKEGSGFIMGSNERTSNTRGLPEIISKYKTKK